MGNEKRATCFATLLQNELNSDVARFTTHVRTCKVASFFFFVSDKPRNIANQPDLQQRCEKVAFFLLPVLPNLK